MGSIINFAAKIYSERRYFTGLSKFVWMKSPLRVSLLALSARLLHSRKSDLLKQAENPPQLNTVVAAAPCNLQLSHPAIITSEASRQMNSLTDIHMPGLKVSLSLQHMFLTSPR